MPDQAERKFANLHFPGIKADPNEGKAKLPEPVRWRFAEQIECMGEAAQIALWDASALVVGATPLGLSIAEKLRKTGFGRVGLYGDRAMGGSHGLAIPAGGGRQAGVFSALVRQPDDSFGVFETFRGEGHDQRIDDVVKGYELVVCAGEDAREVARHARAFRLAFLAAQVTGRVAWSALVPAGTVCEECLQLGSGSEPGVSLPLLELTGARIAARIAGWFLGERATEAYFEGPDGLRRPMEPKPGCAKCGPTPRE